MSVKFAHVVGDRKPFGVFNYGNQKAVAASDN
jgi:hypothetical protein